MQLGVIRNVYTVPGHHQVTAEAIIEDGCVANVNLNMINTRARHRLRSLTALPTVRGTSFTTEIPLGGIGSVAATAEGMSAAATNRGTARRPVAPDSSLADRNC
jgi:hypothetical protein